MVDFIKPILNHFNLSKHDRSAQPDELAKRKAEPDGPSEPVDFNAHKSHAYLTPPELRRTETALKRLLIVGSCFSEAWNYHNGNASNTPVDLVLNNGAGELPNEPPWVDYRDYGGMVVQISLRFIIHDTHLAKITPGDTAAYEKFFEESCVRLKRNLDGAMKWNKTLGIPAFVCNFFIPQANPLGRLAPRYDWSNPMYFMENLNRRLGELVAGYSNAYLLDIDQISAVYGRRYVQEDALLWTSHGSMWPGYPASTTRIEPMPGIHEHYEIRTEIFRNALWESILAMYRTLVQRDAIKLVVLDLDDTLWEGVSAEQAVGTHMLENWFLGIVEALHYLKKRGVLLAIISKNDEDWVRSIWDKILVGRLALEDFSIIRINWQPKPENMREILSQLNLLPRNVLFLDDNPVERSAMQSSFPDMRVLGKYTYYLRRILLWSAETQVATITAESGRRTEMIQAQIERDKQRPELSRAEFLASLGLKVQAETIHRTDHAKFPRALELLNKTNQFNTNGQRWTQEQCLDLYRQGGFFCVFAAVDLFADYGTVGVVVVKGAEIMQLVMSCRVIGLDIEIAVIAQLLKWLRERGIPQVQAAISETSANFACRDLYERCGFMRADNYWLSNDSPLQTGPKHIEIAFSD